MRNILQLVAVIVLLIIGSIGVFNDDLSRSLLVAGIIALIPLTLLILYDVFLNRKRIWLILHCFWLRLCGKKIRFSMSYLYRIKVNDKYLLVKNSNFGHYQLVGGKYKRLDVTQSILKKEFDASDDLKLSTSGQMKDDFALYIPAKNAIKFIDWFNTQKDREISHWREFYEELIGCEHEFLTRKNFPYVNYNLVGTVITPIKSTPGWGECKEILQYDILDLIPTQEQQSELAELKAKGDSAYLKWADEELINNLGHDNSEKTLKYPIGAHTKWALNMKWTNN